MGTSFHFQPPTLHVCKAFKHSEGRQPGQHVFPAGTRSLRGLFKKGVKERVQTASEAGLADPCTGERCVNAGHRQLGDRGKAWGPKVVGCGGVWTWVCVEAQGAPEGRAPREITFRSWLTKDTHAEPILYNAALHLTALYRKGEAKNQAALRGTGWNGILLAAPEVEEKAEYKIKWGEPKFQRWRMPRRFFFKSVDNFWN